MIHSCSSTTLPSMIRVKDRSAASPPTLTAGIETVTYMLEGSVNHRDSLGNAGQIGVGDVQWMTSGRGILHEEMPRRRGPSGNIYGFQLWVNLPAARKMDPLVTRK